MTFSDIGAWTGLLGGAAGLLALMLQGLDSFAKWNAKRFLIEARAARDPNEPEANLSLTLTNLGAAEAQPMSLEILKPALAEFGSEVLADEHDEMTAVEPGGRQIQRFALLKRGQPWQKWFDVYGVNPNDRIQARVKFRDLATSKEATQIYWVHVS